MESMSASFRDRLRSLDWIFDADFGDSEKPLFRRERMLHCLVVGDDGRVLHGAFVHEGLQTAHLQSACMLDDQFLCMIMVARLFLGGLLFIVPTLGQGKTADEELIRNLLLLAKLIKVKLVITKVSEIVLLRYNQDLRSSSFPHLLDQLATDLVAQDLEERFWSSTSRPKLQLFKRQNGKSWADPGKMNGL
ncbi:hypothetical protein AK812_SmicGene41593 [Symbiodinium microadriaticum]|uniref:Uncharacterized protein n=1 Tax=Symbiodinium microadriaticum TaxID=2951 RepID=A0A1Q9C5T1_SYMMI|nr:hypothetical protein AK812_SmicGene41593 [Symbiodinium microadriaticum]CAE7879433.1 unnamed protein product [Symbiodinium microadriaticum]CAE7941665.1 unnamed protein product [Symbiodinium sp. KB8]